MQKYHGDGYWGYLSSKRGARPVPSRRDAYLAIPASTDFTGAKISSIFSASTKS